MLEDQLKILADKEHLGITKSKWQQIDDVEALKHYKTTMKRHKIGRFSSSKYDVSLNQCLRKGPNLIINLCKCILQLMVGTRVASPPKKVLPKNKK